MLIRRLAVATVPPEIPVRLSAREYEVLQGLARIHEMTDCDVLRQALRLYQTVQAHAMRGERVAFVDETGRVVACRPMLASVCD